MFNLFLRMGLTYPFLPAAYARTGKIKHFCGISYPIGKFLRERNTPQGVAMERRNVIRPQGVVAERRNVMEPWRHPNRTTIRHAPSGAVAKRLGLGRTIRPQKEVPDWTPLFVCGWRDSNSHRKNSHYPLKVARLPFRHIRFELGLQR